MIDNEKTHTEMGKQYAGDSMSCLSFVKREIHTFFFKKAWRRANAHNFTYVKSPFSMDLVTVGKQTYGCVDVHLDNTVNKLHIGSYCSLAERVRFLVSADHNVDCVRSVRCGLPSLCRGYERERVALTHH